MKELFLLRCINHYFISSISCRIFLNVHCVTARSWNEWSENTELAVIIEKNPEALLQRVRLIKNAKKEIILSTFAFQSDESGKLILGALHDAADRGIHIRLLVDGMKSWIDMKECPARYWKMEPIVIRIM